MFGIKKKLTSLIPSDARAHLQNALTVEWDDGNKTVLVDIPTRDNEDVELEGINAFGSGRGTAGRGRSNSSAGYGKLADDDEDKYTRAYRSSSRGQSSTAQGSGWNSTSHSNSNYGSGSGSNSGSNYSNSTYPSYQRTSSSNHKTLPPLPPRSSTNYSFRSGQNGTSNSNPFEENDFDYPSPVPSTSTYASSGPGHSPYTTTDAQFALNHPFENSTFGNSSFTGNGNTGRRGQGGNPWATFRADEVDMLGDDEYSKRRIEEERESDERNPFR